MVDQNNKLIPKHGGFRKLKTFQLARLIFDIVCVFLDRQLAAQTDAFQKEGGFTERLYKMRTASRGVR